jgi:hypothetical protein
VNAAIAAARYLSGKGLVSYDEVGTGGNCFLNHLPAQPNVAVMVKQTGGNPVPAGGSLGYDEPTVQLLVRGTRDPRSGAALADALYSEMQGLRGTIDPTGENVYVARCLAAQSAPVHIGVDENERHLYSLNFALHVRNITQHRE